MVASLNGIIISEILADPNSGANNFDTDGNGTASAIDEFVELHNPTTAAIDISGYQLWDEAIGNWFTFPTNTILEPGAYAAVIVQVQSGGSLPTPTGDNLFFDAAASNIGILANGGDNVVLYDPSTDIYINATYNSDPALDPTTDFTGFSLTASQSGTTDDFGFDVDGLSIERFSTEVDVFEQSTPTPGEGPAAPGTLNGISFNEFVHSPSGGDQDFNGDGVADNSDEVIEFVNLAAAPVNIGGWEVWGNGSLIHTFATNIILNNGEHFSLVDSADGTANPINGIPGQSAYSDQNVGISAFTSHFLYDPNTDTYIGVFGPTIGPGFSNSDINAFLTAHPTATPAFAIETMPALGVAGTSIGRPNDGDATLEVIGESAGEANCFLTGTAIATPTGERAVEDLTRGDEILTAEGRVVFIKWVGRQTLQRATHGPNFQPVRIRAGALGNSLPSSDLMVTADHGMVFPSSREAVGDQRDGYVINASALVNGDTVDWVPTAELGDSFTVYHIETDAYEVILANGAPSETFIDVAGRVDFDNYQEYLDLYGHERIIPVQALLRISTARLVPQTIRDRIGRPLRAVG